MQHHIKRKFLFGEEWLYYKLYMGAKVADEVLVNIIKPLSEKFLKEGHILKWFFIRYADPMNHLRIRFHITNPEDIIEISKNFNQYIKPYIEEDLIWKVELGTYEREIERYGINSMVLSENLFYYDSKMVVTFLDLLEHDEDEELRWLFSLKCIDNLLNIFKLNLDHKAKLLEHLKTGFELEFGADKSVRRQLDNKFRFHRNKISMIMQLIDDKNSKYTKLIGIIEDFSNSSNPIANKLLILNEKNAIRPQLENILSSYIHMSMNRIFKSKNRIHELVCYYLLFKFYKSAVAKREHLNKNKK